MVLTHVTCQCGVWRGSTSPNPLFRPMRAAQSLQASPTIKLFAFRCNLVFRCRRYRIAIAPAICVPAGSWAEFLFPCAGWPRAVWRAQPLQALPLPPGSRGTTVSGEARPSPPPPKLCGIAARADRDFILKDQPVHRSEAEAAPPWACDYTSITRSWPAIVRREPCNRARSSR